MIFNRILIILMTAWIFLTMLVYGVFFIIKPKELSPQEENLITIFKYYDVVKDDYDRVREVQTGNLYYEFITDDSIQDVWIFYKSQLNKYDWEIVNESTISIDAVYPGCPTLKFLLSHDIQYQNRYTLQVEEHSCK